MPKPTVKLYQPLCPNCGQHMVEQDPRELLVMEEVVNESPRCINTINVHYECNNCPWVRIYISK